MKVLAHKVAFQCLSVQSDKLICTFVGPGRKNNIIKVCLILQSKGTVKTALTEADQC